MSNNKQELLPFTKEVSEEFTQTMHLQDLKGLEKYNQALDPMDKKYDWLAMATEELADAVKYFKAEQKRRDVVLKSVINQLTVLELHSEANQDTLTSHSVRHIMNELKQLSHNIK